MLLLGAMLSLPLAGAQAGTVDLGSVTVSTIGHVVLNLASPAPFGGSYVTDYLVNQQPDSNGGGVLSPESVNFDTNNQFVLKITAPPRPKIPGSCAGRAISIYERKSGLAGIQCSDQ